MAIAPVGAGTPETLEQLYAAIAPLSMDGGWRRTPGARVAGSFEPGHWRYTDGRAALDAAAKLIGPDLAERRNIILLNPGGPDSTLATLVSAYQSVLPGERARSHRHTANALRLVLDASSDMYTIVDGERLDMHPGDVVLTPNWCWHGHANDGDGAACFLDYLDSPLCRSLGQYAFEPYPSGYQTVTSRPRETPYVYAWAKVKSALDQAPFDPARHFARHIALDRYPLKTIGLAMSSVERARPGVEFATGANAIYSVVTGSGRSTVDGRTFDWERGDVFAVPADRPQLHASDGSAVLFCVSDEPLLAGLGLLSRTLPPTEVPDVEND